MAIEEIPRRFRFTCDILGCAVFAETDEPPTMNATLPGWITVRAKTSMHDTGDVALCPKHALAVQKALGGLSDQFSHLSPPNSEGAARTNTMVVRKAWPAGEEER